MIDDGAYKKHYDYYYFDLKSSYYFLALMEIDMLSNISECSYAPNVLGFW